MGALNPCCKGWKHLWSPERKLKKTAHLHSKLSNKTLGLGTQASFVCREVNSAALARCSLSFHSHLLSPLLVWYGRHGGTCSLEQGRCKIHPHCAERQSMDYDPPKPCHMVLLQFPREICVVLSTLPINSPKRSIFYFSCTYNENLFAWSIMYFADVGVMFPGRKRCFG